MRVANPKSSSVAARRSSRSLSVEALETRTLFAVTIEFDYSHDTLGFFDSPQRRTILQAAADRIASRFGDQLLSIEPSGGNSYELTIFNPVDADDSIEIDNRVIPANTIVVYAGGGNLGGNILGLGGPASVSATGSSAWVDRVLSRGQGDTDLDDGDPATDFGPAAGCISFTLTPPGGWYFGLDPAGVSVATTDFYSVALHEMAHLLGFGLSDSFESLVSGQTFSGPASVFEYDGNGNPPVDSGAGHWGGGVTDGGVEADMTPTIPAGIRKEFTSLDFAGLDDLGWEIPLSAALNPVSSASDAGASSKTFTVTYSHYTAINAGTLGTDVTVTGPNGVAVPAQFIGSSGSGKAITATYAITSPDGSFGADDAGTYTVRTIAGAVGDAFGNSTPAATLGTFSVDIGPPVPTLAVQDITTVGGGVQTFAVTYTDGAGIQAETIDVNDVTVTRQSDGLALSVLNVSVSPPTDDPSVRVATYTVAAPGGLWDTTDNGTYNIAINANQVTDTTATPADAGVIGSFLVDINAVAFSAGNDYRFTDATGDPVTVSLKGPGSGQIAFTSSGNADISQIVLSSSAISSALTITAGGAGTPVGELTVNGSLKSFTGKNTDLAGAMTVSGVLPKILFRNAGGSMTLNGSAPATITLAQAQDFALTASAGIKALKLNAWLDTDGTPDLLTTSVLSSLAVKGAMQAGITADTIGKTTITGALTGAEIRATTSIAAITVGSIADSLVFAGVRGDVSDLPDAADDYTNPGSVLTSFTVKSKVAGSFSNTRIAGGSLGKLAVGSVSTTNNGSVFGVTGLTIASISGVTNGATKFKLSKLDAPAQSSSVGDFAIRLL